MQKSMSNQFFPKELPETFFGLATYSDNTNSDDTNSENSDHGDSDGDDVLPSPKPANSGVFVNKFYAGSIGFSTPSALANTYNPPAPPPTLASRKKHKEAALNAKAPEIFANSSEE